MKCLPHALSSSLLLSLLVLPVTGRGQSFEDASHLFIGYSSQRGVGASLVDVNADGLPDIYHRNTLHLQRIDGRFEDVFIEMGLAEQLDGGFGAIFGDINNDGLVEAFQIDLDPSLPFYLNRSGMRFVEHSNDSGIRDIALVQGSSFLDFDSNGLLDLFVGIDGGRPNLYWNVGLDHFLDRGAQYRFDLRYAYGVAAADYDRDGDPDILVTQCFPPPADSLRENVLYRNDGDYFTNVREQAGIVDDLSSWGVVWLDYDNDGLFDFYVGNTSNVRDGDFGFNTLYRNRGDGTFEDMSVEAGVQHSHSSQSIGVSAADFDNDGWVDIFVAEASAGQASLYRNDHDGTFTDIWSKTSSPAFQSQAVAVGDVNNDGWIDIFQPASRGDQLLLNRGGRNGFLKVELRGRRANHFGVGGRIDLYGGGLHQVREITAGDGMTSQNHNLSAHFGLGQVSLVDSLTVQWPGGALETYPSIAPNQSITIVQGVGVNSPPGMFRLVSPLSKATISSGVETLRFRWSPSVDDVDQVLYSLNIDGADLDTTISELTSNSLELERSIFRDGYTYRWNVLATDGYSVRAARYSEFVFGPTTAVEEDRHAGSAKLRLAVHPNPFSDRVWITVGLETEARLRIEVFDLAGRRVTVLQDAWRGAGRHEVAWNQSVSAGTYIVSAATSFGRANIPLVRQ